MLVYFFLRDDAHRALHSFPTRRSSDLLRSASAAGATDSSPATSSCAAGPSRPESRELVAGRSEEHTSELQSLTNLVCRLLLEKKKIITSAHVRQYTRPGRTENTEPELK